MVKSTLCAAFLALIWISHAFATSVGFSATPTARTAVDSKLVPLSAGSLVWIGTFANEAFLFNPALTVAANVSAISSAGGFKQFGIDVVTGTPNTGVSSSLGISSSLSGKVGGQVTDNSSGPTKADFFDGKPVYLWLFNASTVAAATDTGIFRATSATPAFLFPTNANGVGDSVTLSLTPAAAPTVVAIGGTGTASSSQLILAAAVPEPSSALLIGVGMFSALAVRRRKTDHSRLRYPTSRR